MENARAIEIAIEYLEYERDNLFDTAMEVVMWNGNRPPRGELRRKHDEYFEILDALKVLQVVLEDMTVDKETP